MPSELSTGARIRILVASVDLVELISSLILMYNRITIGRREGTEYKGAAVRKNILYLMQVTSEGRFMSKFAAVM